MKHYLCAGLSLSHILLVAGLSCAADFPSVQAESSFPEIVVQGERIVTPTRQTDETVYTGSEITTAGIERNGARARTSIYESINLLGGLNLESPDGRGLGVEQSTIRNRGIRGILGALTVVGIPNYGGNPIGPRDYLYDLENMGSLAVYKGAVPADIGTGVGSRGGAIELRPDWPHETFGARLSQGIGSDDYYRIFVRLDSGAIPALGTRFSGSYSHTQADKWRGPGDLERNNFNLALTQPITNRADIKLWYNYNSIAQDLYRALTYTQTTNLDANYSLDYNTALTGTPATDISYYKYNHGDFINRDVLSVITVRPADELRLTIKPYHLVEDTTIKQGVTSGSNYLVQQRTRDIERTGVIAETSYGGNHLKGVVGYHYEAVTMDIYTQNFAITPVGLAYRGYGVFASSGTGQINSPYAKLTGTIGPVNWQGGIKYFNYAEPASQGYTTGPGPGYAKVRASDLDRQARTYDSWLPTAGLSCTLSDDLQVYASYGKNFIRPYSYLPLTSLYNSNRATFMAQGISLNDLYRGYDIEKSDTFDLGVRYRGEMLEFAPAFFFGWHRNLLTTVYDPRVNLSYQQNVGRATSYGLEMEMNVYLTDTLTMFLNPTYTSMTYDSDLTYQGNRLATQGNQVTDTPEWMLKGGLTWKWRGIEVTPTFRIIGPRYGDVEHKEKIDTSAIADLSLSYTVKNMLKTRQIKFSIDLTNITDEKYVAVINSSDDTRAGTTSYYQGAPLSIIGTVAVEL